ncbi:MAG: DUF2335 domain-containing protein [Treponemataceae bacterium]
MSNRYNKRLTGKSGQIQVTQTISSALPPPVDLKAYEEIYPGTTKIFVDALKKQSEHRMDLEDKVISAGLKSSFIGQILSFILAFSAIVGGVILVLFNKDAIGFASIIGSLATLVSVFIYGKKSNKKELSQKAQQNPDF